MDEKEAVARKILFIILIIIIFVSIMGTWTILSYVDSLKAKQTVQSNVVVSMPNVRPSSGTVIEVKIKENPNLEKEEKSR